MILFLLSLLALNPDANADLRTFDKVSYNLANQRGDLIVLDFHTLRCPKCKDKSPILEQVIAKRGLNGKVIPFLVDYDKERGLKSKFDVEFRSTIVFVHKNKELDRVSGVIRHENLERAYEESLLKVIGRKK